MNSSGTYTSEFQIPHLLKITFKRTIQLVKQLTMLKLDVWILCSQKHTNHWNYIIPNAFIAIWMIKTQSLWLHLKKKRIQLNKEDLEQQRKPAEILKFTFPKPQFRSTGGLDGAVFTRPEHIWPINNLANKLIPRDYKQILRGTRFALHLRRRINWPCSLRDWNKKRLDNWYPAECRDPYCENRSRGLRREISIIEGLVWYPVVRWWLYAYFGQTGADRGTYRPPWK